MKLIETHDGEQWNESLQITDAEIQIISIEFSIASIFI